MNSIIIASKVTKDTLIDTTIDKLLKDLYEETFTLKFRKNIENNPFKKLDENNKTRKLKFST